MEQPRHMESTSHIVIKRTHRLINLHLSLFFHVGTNTIFPLILPIYAVLMTVLIALPPDTHLYPPAGDQGTAEQSMLTPRK